ncbi:MAG: alpha/beta hydrolase family protein [Candidatus Geothermincolia bacterium]
MRLKAIRAAACITALLFSTLVFSAGCGRQAMTREHLEERGALLLQQMEGKALEGYDLREAFNLAQEVQAALAAGDLRRAEDLMDEATRLVGSGRQAGERMYYSSGDATRISGLLFRPDAAGSWPLIVVSHSGFTQSSGFINIALGLRDMGYMTLVPDFRGSGGSAGQIELAGGEVDDLLAGVDELEARGLIEDSRIGIYGQSHGGAIAMLAAERDARIKAVVEEAGFSDLAQLYQHLLLSSDVGARELLQYGVGILGGTPEQFPELYRQRSAINYVDSFNAPLLIAHGAADPVVPLAQAQAMYDAMLLAGKTVEIRIYPDEQHCIASPANREELSADALAWFQRYL